MDNNNEHLYSLFDIKLDNIAEKILLSKVNDEDDILSKISSHIEGVFIQTALKITGNNISRAAKLLGINRNTLSRKVKESSSNNGH
ncbi:MAG TPA: helix-turn-helix domain-containing protein [Syntrophorhabdaceae bacterium]|nr:helix-turn-helix domain-containing protein [Syntrophorhabdaceae bacterium]